MEYKALTDINEIVEEIQKLIGNKSLKIYAPVKTPDGDRVLIMWNRALPSGIESELRAVIGLDIDNALRRVLAFEDDYQDFIEPDRAKNREKELANLE